MRVLGIVALGLLCCTCAVEVSLEGKRCPCLADYACVNDTCVPRSGGGSGGAGDCMMGVGAFRGTWATPHGIRWEWEPVGDEQNFQEYRLVTGPTPNDVEERTPASRTWTSKDNPELGVFKLPRTGNPETVRRTITDALQPLTAYSAELDIVDTAGCVARSPNIAGKTTTDATPGVPVMHDVATAAGSWGELMFTTSGCYGSSPGCWVATGACGADAKCYENFQRGGVDVSFSLGAGAFSTAYLEFQVNDDAQVQSWWGSVLLMFADAQTAWATEPVIFRPQGGYRKIEVPFAALVRQDTANSPNPVPLAFGDIGGKLEVFSVGLEVASGNQLWVDEVWIGW